VQVGVRSGGRGPAEQVTVLPWGDERVPELDPGAPWPGRAPAPAPATVPVDQVDVQLLDATGIAVAVTGRGEVSGAPTTLVHAGQRRSVQAWTGPWPVDERWWDPAAAHRGVRVQVFLSSVAGPGGVTELGGQALLLQGAGGRWHVEGVYD